MDEIEKLKLKNQAMMEQLFSVIEQNIDNITDIANGDLSKMNDAMAIGLASAVLGFYYQHIVEVAEGEKA